MAERHIAMMKYGNMAIWQYGNMAKWGEEAYDPAIEVRLCHSKEVSEIALLAKKDVSVRVISSGGHATLEPKSKGHLHHTLWSNHNRVRTCDDNRNRNRHCNCNCGRV